MVESVEHPRPESAGGIPDLRINVFGGFEVFLGGEPLDDGCLQRQKVKNLATILALHPGLELSCEHLATLFWPHCSDQKKRHSFYNIWSLLRRSLTLETGECPYLVRHQNSCKLVEAHVQSDAAEIKGLCDRLQYGDGELCASMDAYRALQKSYRGDLLPGETQNSAIVRERAEWRERVIESLISASLMLDRRSEYGYALWFAQAAARLEWMREDVCQLQMRLLIHLGNSASALRLFIDLRDYLADELGIDPSPQTVALYNEIILNDSTQTGVDSDGQPKGKGDDGPPAPSSGIVRVS